MEDIFITDPRQASAKKIAKKATLNPKNKRGFFQYIFDLIIKTLLVIRSKIYNQNTFGFFCFSFRFCSFC